MIESGVLGVTCPLMYQLKQNRIMNSLRAGKLGASWALSPLVCLANASPPHSPLQSQFASCASVIQSAMLYPLMMLMELWRSGKDQGSFGCYFFNPASKACSDVAAEAFLEGRRSGRVRIYRDEDFYKRHQEYTRLLRSRERIFVLPMRAPPTERYPPG